MMQKCNNPSFHQKEENNPLQSLYSIKNPFTFVPRYQQTVDGVFKKLYNFIKIYRGMEQLVARRAHNPKVTGSSPVPATW